MIIMKVMVILLMIMVKMILPSLTDDIVYNPVHFFFNANGRF